MDGEWRVSLMVHGQLATSKPVSPDIVRDLLRSGVGEEISVSAGKTGVFLYAATADAARIAERIADEALARQGLGADIRQERWDPSRGAWLDVRTGLPADAAAADVLPGRGRRPGRRRLRSAGALIAAIIDGIGGDWLYPGIRVVACGGVGTDIYGGIEHRHPGAGSDWYEGDAWLTAIGLSPLYDETDYAAFGCLFGVRNYAGFTPLAAGRGLPAGLSAGLRASWTDRWRPATWSVRAG